MNILGIDGGMTNLGLGAISLEDDKLALVTHGLIHHPANDKVKFNVHLNAGITQIVTAFPRALDIVNPTFIVAETIPPGRLGANDSLVIAAVTTCKVIAIQFGIPWYDIAASTVKKELTGDGRATKVKVRNAVFDIFPEVEVTHKLLKQEQKNSGEKPTGLPFDVFDGLAIAIVGAWKYGKGKETS